MRTAVLAAKEKIVIKDVPVPEINDNEVLIKVAFCGICGSDNHVFHDTHSFKKMPYYMGHEVSGTIEKIGAKVTKFAVGDKVTVDPHTYCHKCNYCKDGNEELCEELTLLGQGEWYGGASDFIFAQEDITYKLSDNVSLETGAVTEPLSIALAINNCSEPSKRNSIAIIGCGPIGQMEVVAAKSRGFKTILCSSRTKEDRDMAMKFGATKVYNPREVNIVDEILKETDGKGVDFTVLTVASGELLEESFLYTAKLGHIAYLAAESRQVCVNFAELINKEIHLIGSNGCKESDFAEAVAIINAGLNIDGFVTKIFPLSQSQKAMEFLDKKCTTNPVIKVMVYPD